MNHLVTELGGRPSEVQKSDFELPEIFEWFFSKLLGGSKKSGASPSPSTGLASEGASTTENFMTHFLEAIEDAVGAGLRLSEGVIESLAALAKNPKQPELVLITLIETFRDVIIQLLDSAEQLVLGLLDVVARVFEGIKTVLNTEIKIPFISELFKLIGAGKLTILNLSSLFLAIPVTVIGKIATGEHLFRNVEAVPQLSTQPNGQFALSRSAASIVEDTARDQLERKRRFSIVAMVADTLGHVVNFGLDLADVPEERDQGISPISAKEEGDLAQGASLFEYISLICDGVGYFVSFPYDSQLTGKARKIENAFWGIRGIMYTFDAAILGLNSIQSVAGGQRMRRVNASLIFVWTIYGLIDLTLFSVYTAAANEQNKRVKRAGISAQVFSFFPDFLAFFGRGLIEKGIKNKVTFIIHGVQVGSNLAAMVTSLVTGSIVIREVNKDLDELGKLPQLA